MDVFIGWPGAGVWSGVGKHYENVDGVYVC